MRAKRYALVVEDGKVKSVHVEPDNTGTDGEYLTLCNSVCVGNADSGLVSMADKVLG